MKIQIAKLDLAHSKLYNPYDFGSFCYAIERDDDPDDETRPLSEHGPVEMFPPLDFANFEVCRFEDIYYASVTLKARNPKAAFKDISEMLVNVFKEADMDFYQTSKNGIGHIQVGDVPLYSVVEGGENHRFRSIGLGRFGSETRIFPDDEKVFAEEIVGLETVANLYIQACYAHANVEVPNITLDLNPMP